MKARRVLLLSALGLSAACATTMLSACGDDDTTIIYVVLEAGTDAKKPTPVGNDDDDAAVPTCGPVTVPSFTFKVPAPYAGACTEKEINDFYDACATDGIKISDCTAAKDANTKCSSCLFGDPLDATQRPWTVYTEQILPFPNYGLCMAMISGETAATACSNAYGQFITCIDSACITPCLQADEDTYKACQQASIDNGNCQAGGSQYSSTKCQKAYGDTTYGFCTADTDGQGNDIDVEARLKSFAKFACGTAPDGGVDGGADAGDAGDAGDSGDAGDAGDADADAGTN